jgi:hypothetical protein
MKTREMKGGNKMERKYILGVVILSLILISGIGSVSAFGFDNWFARNTNPVEMQEEQSSIQTAIKDNDYNTWKSLVESKLTEENFNQIVLRYTEMSEKKDSAKDNTNVPDNSGDSTFQLKTNGNCKNFEGDSFFNLDNLLNGFLR